MIKLRAISLATLAVLAAFAGAQTGKPIIVVVDGTPVTFPNQQPQMNDARVFVPLRGVFEILGAKVDWDPATQSITAKTRSTKVKLAIGQLDASVNDQPVHMDVPATLVGGSTMVPLRFVSEALGAIVTWNPANQEVDIKSKVDYSFPKGHEHDRRPKPPIAPPPPPPHHDDWIIFTPDSVVPFILNTRLNSGNAHVGDQFMAGLDTHGHRDYFGLPAGTNAYGVVSYVRHQHGRDPGVLELAFDHITLPNGRTIPVNGRIFDIRNGGAVQLPNGSFIARGIPRHDHAVFTGYGPGPGIIVGFKSNHVIVDAEIGGLLGRYAPPPRPNFQPRNVELTPGTPIAIRLYSELRFHR